MQRAGFALGALAAAIGALAAAPLPGGGSGSPIHGRASLLAQADISSNWSGYVATGPGSTSTTASTAMSYTDVTGQWVQPAATCKPGVSTSVAIWVGLGGYSETSQKLEQTGTSADCAASGKASYYIWYELVPADSVNVKLKIYPGDTIASVVEVTGTTHERDVLVQVIDRTRNTRFTKHLSMRSPDLTSAEWIVEAPSQCGDSGFCRQIPLTRFGPVSFSRSYATGNNVGGTISSSNWLSTALQLVPRAHRVYGQSNDPTVSPTGAGADASTLTSDGTGFTVTWDPTPAVAVA